MSASGINFTGQSVTTCDNTCNLNISQWSRDIDPFSIHSLCSTEILTTSQSVSYSSDDCNPQNPSKRQKTDMTYSWREPNAFARSRSCTFSDWIQPETFKCRVIEAGFFSCNLKDRVICIHCNLICEQWNTEHDPCEVHKILSSNCLFVKSMLKYTPLSIYANPEQRLASFSNWSNKISLSIDKLVHAGFIFDGSQIKCFYCHGLFKHCDSINHPLVEHIRWFPYCNYARQLCGEELYYKIQRSINTMPINNQLENSFDENTISQHVAAYVDLPSSKYLINQNQFEPSLIQRCLQNQFRLKNNGFTENTDLYIACLILQKHDKFGEIKKNIKIPTVEMQKIYRSRQLLANNVYQLLSYTDILISFENDLQKYKNQRQKLSEEFIEEKSISIEREKSLHKWSFDKPSRYDITRGGWIIYDNYSKCPHCHIQYNNWKSDDNPLDIHKYLSPLCLFVLSTNPFNYERIPIKKMDEEFTDEFIINAASQPYTGLVRARHESGHTISDRLNSFEQFPDHGSNDTNELAISGIYYDNRTKTIKCFYCESNMRIINGDSSFTQCFQHLHRVSNCHYIKQINDVNSHSLKQQPSNKCSWCMVNEKRLMALPCRHFCLCDQCAHIKQLCPICQIEVTAYVIVYSS
ncbi:unnamed protein product [Adineta steineri]|uniref:RING-type domain-containing protein n=2 Tax=Adineta steineri TaxID=433720 RepID=A0A815HH98_9BILA|nr:unnamed protein product [Adineta steineri]